VLSGRLVVPRARESSFGLGVLHAVGLSVSVQHYGGIWPRTAVALRCGGVLSFFLRWWASLQGFVTRMSAVCGWSCGFALVFSVVVCVQCPAMLTSQSIWPVSIVRAVTRVDVPIQPGEFVSLFLFFSCL
jgi:hypothetical protein